MFAESLEQFHWYAIQTRSRHEKVVRDQLAAKSITHLLPLWQKRSTWKDRVKLVDVPLFGGYLFGYFPLLNRFAVLETVGVVRIVGLNCRPVPIPDEQIATVRTLMEQRLPCSPHPYLVEGMRVRIKRGLLECVTCRRIGAETEQDEFLAEEIDDRLIRPQPDMRRA